MSGWGDSDLAQAFIYDINTKPATYKSMKRTARDAEKATEFRFSFPASRRYEMAIWFQSAAPVLVDHCFGFMGRGGKGPSRGTGHIACCALIWFAFEDGEEEGLITTRYHCIRKAARRFGDDELTGVWHPQNNYDQIMFLCEVTPSN